MKILSSLLAATLCLSGSVASATDTPAAPSLVLFQTAPADKPESRRFDSPTAFHQGILKALKAEGRPLATTLTSEALAEASVLVVINSTRPYEPAELAAIEAFVRKGGSLLVVVDEDRRYPRTREIHNPLLAPFGLSFTEDQPDVHNVGASAEPGPFIRARYELPYSGGRAVTGGTPFSFIMDTDRVAHAAYVELPDGGRVIAMGEAMAHLGLGKPEGVRLTGVPRDPAKTTYWGKDARPFMTDLFAWLLHTTSAP